MGTSKSYGGPSDVSRLLPSWALPDAGASGGIAGGGAGGPAGAPEGGTAAAPSAAPQGGPQVAPGGDRSGTVPGTSPPGPPLPGQSTPPASPQPTGRPWTAAKRSLGVALRGSGGHRDYRRAARDYVRARGGARRATTTSSSGRAATTRLASFLSSVASGGVATAVRQLGLATLAGRPAHDVLAAVTNAIAPRGATLEDAAARQAIADTLAGLWDAQGVTDGGIDRLQAMTPDDVRGAITESVSAYIFYRWVLELGRAIERRAVSTNEALTMEREMRQYIRDTLKLDLAGTDVLRVDWAGAEGQHLVEKVFTEAYDLIESNL